MGVWRDLVFLLRIGTLSEDNVGVGMCCEDNVGVGMGCDVFNVLMGGWTLGFIEETVFSVDFVVTWYIPEFIKSISVK